MRRGLGTTCNAQDSTRRHQPVSEENRKFLGLNNVSADFYFYSTNTSVVASPDRIDPNTLNIPRGEEWAPAPIDPAIDKWFFISGASV